MPAVAACFLPPQSGAKQIYRQTVYEIGAWDCSQVTLIAQLLCHLRPLTRFPTPGQYKIVPLLLTRLAGMVRRPSAAMATEAGERGFRALIGQLLRPPSPTGASDTRKVICWL